MNRKFIKADKEQRTPLQPTYHKDMQYRLRTLFAGQSHLQGQEELFLLNLMAVYHYVLHHTSVELNQPSQSLTGTMQFNHHFLYWAYVGFENYTVEEIAIKFVQKLVYAQFHERDLTLVEILQPK